MIVVVEGPSVAGKTTWTARHCDPAVIVAETTAAQAAAGPGQREYPGEAAEFWAQLNSARWEQALRIEEASGVAVCDSDPFKLHYPWTLWRIGHAHRDAWTIALEASRPFFDTGRLGLADLILVAIPDRDTLIRRRDGDGSRRRRNFDLHVQLAAAFAEWYRAIEQLDPARVIWRLPPEGPAGQASSPRASQRNPRARRSLGAPSSELILVSGDHGYRKPDRRLFQAALDEMGQFAVYKKHGPTHRVFYLHRRHGSLH